LGQRARQTHESEQAPGPFPRESHACRQPLGATLQVDSKESGVGRRDERSRFAVEVVLLSPLFTSTFGLVLGGFSPCQHITDGSIPLDGSPFQAMPGILMGTLFSHRLPTYSALSTAWILIFSNLRTLTLNPCRGRMPWRTPHFRKRTPKMPLKKPPLFMTKHPTQQGNLTTTIMHQLMVHQA
jgi:hypothetical protein